MQFVQLFLFLASILAVATASGPNAERMARGLPPLPPRALYAPSNVAAAKRGTPSNTSPCSTTPQCCTSTGHSSDSLISILLALLGIVVDVNVLIGQGCSSYSANTCHTSPLCCSQIGVGSGLAIGCVTITL